MVNDAVSYGRVTPFADHLAAASTKALVKNWVISGFAPVNAPDAACTLATVSTSSAWI